MSRHSINPAYKLVLKSFDVEATLVDNHVCGGYDGEFQAMVELGAEELDENGFVTDNVGFIEFCNDRFSQDLLKASCEELAAGLVALAYEKVGPRLVTCFARVRNQTGHAEMTWEQGQMIPRFPRPATREERESTEAGEGPRSC